MSELPAFPPAVSVETKPFWDATAEGRLLLPRCDACGTVIWYPRTICPDCHSSEVSWIEASGRGTIYSFTIQRRSGGPFRDALPYVLAYVELEEGPRVLTNVIECDPSALQIDQRVEVVFCDTGEGAALPRFRPTG